MLRNILNNEMDKLNISQSILANNIKLDKGTISRFFSAEKETSFESVVKIVRELSPSREMELMGIYALEVEKRENIINSFEYTSIHRLFDVTEKLIERWSKSDNVEIRELVSLYTLSIRFQKDSNSSIYEDVKSLRVKSEFAEIFRYLLMAHDSYRTLNFNRVLEFATHVESTITRMKESFVKRSYLVRVYELYAHTYMRVHNDVDTTRTYANYVIDLSDSVIYRANAHITLGLSYMFEHYEMALKHFLSARELLEIIGCCTYNAESNIYFLRNLWLVECEIPSEQFSAELAHYYIVRGKEELGLSILDKLENTSFRYYYRWKATKDTSNLFKSTKLLSDYQDRFYINRLLKPELVKAGVDPLLIEVVCQ